MAQKARRELIVIPKPRKRRMRSVLRYTGSKAYDISGWLPFVPPHTTYVELFSGSAEMFFAKDRAEVEVLNDLGPDLVNFFRVVRSDELWESLSVRCMGATCSKESWEKAVRVLAKKRGGRVLRAWAYFVRMEQSFWGMASSFGGGSEKTWQNRVRRLSDAHERLRGCHVEGLDFRKSISKWDSDGTLFYLDPPAVPGTRESKIQRSYSNTLTMKDWGELLDALMACSGMVLLAPYADHPILSSLRKRGWECVIRQERKRGKLRTARLWMNPSAAMRRNPR